MCYVLAVKRKTASTAVIRWLNRFGHCVTYNEINAVKTKLAENQVCIEDIRKFEPRVIQPNLFVTFVYDNCDHSIQSIYNAILHGTNGIVIQLSTAMKTQADACPQKRSGPSHQRSFKPVQQNFQPFCKLKSTINRTS